MTIKGNNTVNDKLIRNTLIKKMRINGKKNPSPSFPALP